MGTPSLREALASLQQMVECDTRWQLPEYVQLTPPAWMALPRLLVPALAVLLWLAFAGSAGTMELAVLTAVLGVGCVAHVRLGRRRSLPLGEGSLRADQGRGCCVEVLQRVVSTQGVEPALQCTLEHAQDWSVGCVAFTDRPRRRYGWRVELRHVRRGPVLRLCTVLHEGHAVQQLDALDTLVNHMAARLGIRRSGAALAAASVPP